MIMNADMEGAIHDALMKGWRATSLQPHRAVFSYPGSRSMGTTENLVCLALTLVTCGLALVVWLPCLFISALTAQPAQTLILTLTGHGIVREVVRS